MLEGCRVLGGLGVVLRFFLAISKTPGLNLPVFTTG